MSKTVSGIRFTGEITSIGAQAFDSFPALRCMVIPEGVVSIGNAAFSGCGLEELTVPSTVRTIGDGAFQYTNRLSKVWFNAENCLVSGKDSGVFKDSGSAIDGMEVFFGDTVKKVPSFLMCYTLENYDAPKVRSIWISDSVIEIGEKVFDRTEATDLHLGENVSVIGVRAFSSIHISSLKIPDSVTYIGHGAFGYGHLTDVWIPSNTRGDDTAFDHSDPFYNGNSERKGCVLAGSAMKVIFSTGMTTSSAP
ncbi:MAG: leucine-rich repeat domain-containing protein [archaeon]|nr:leucine-rich repeat domain-containing protein [archaeon]